MRGTLIRNLSKELQQAIETDSSEVESLSVKITKLYPSKYIKTVYNLDSVIAYGRSLINR